MPRKKEKLIKALQIILIPLQLFVMLSYGNTPLSLSVWNLSIMDSMTIPEQRYNYHRLCGHAVWSNKTKELIHLIGNIFKQLKWNNQLIWVSYTSDGLRVGLDL